MLIWIQVNDSVTHNEVSVRDDEMMTLEYDLEPVERDLEPVRNDTNTVEGKGDSRALDSLPTQLIADEMSSQVICDVGSRSQQASQSSVTAATQVFDRSQSQLVDEAATQTFPASSSIRGDSQSDFLATQVFEALGSNSGSLKSHSESGKTQQKFDDSACLKKSYSQTSRESNSQTDFLATQVFEAVITTQQKSQMECGKMGQNSNDPLSSQSHPSISQTDLLPTQVFTEYSTVVANQRDGSSPANQRAESSPAVQAAECLSANQIAESCPNEATQTFAAGSSLTNHRAEISSANQKAANYSANQGVEFSPNEATQTFAAPTQPRRTSKDGSRTTGVDKDGSRVSFSPSSCSTQMVCASETSLPHLSLELSECNDSIDDDVKRPAALRTSMRRRVTASSSHLLTCVFRALHRVCEIQTVVIILLQMNFHAFIHVYYTQSTVSMRHLLRLEK